MPTYEYECTACGPFEAFRPMAESAAPQPCPDCGDPAARAWLTAPAFAGMNAELRVAHATNERSAHAPRVASTTRAARHTHGPNCGCGGGKGRNATVKAANGAKSFPSKRPWMISH